MKAQIDELRELLSEAGDQDVEIPVEALGFGDGLRVLFPDGVLRFATVSVGAEGSAVGLEAGLPAPGVPAHLLARCLGLELPSLPGPGLDRLSLLVREDADSMLTATGPGGSVRLWATDERVFCAESDDWQVICTGQPLTADRLTGLGVLDLGRAVLPDPFTEELPAGAWLLLPELPLRPRRILVPLALPRAERPLDPSRLDGLGRPLPVAAPPVRRGYSRPVRAVATADGFALVAGTSAGAERGNGRWSLEISEDGAVVSVDYDYSPLRLAGGLGLLPAKAPYKAIVGGVLMFSFGAAGGKGLYGTGLGAYVIPESGAAKPSFFGYVGIGGDPGIGIPAIRVTGISAGLGWNSRIRIPEISELGNFPFLKALDNPAAIGAEGNDPVEILKKLSTGADAWVTAADDELWVAAGLGFRIAELVSGRALAVVHVGQELTIALIGTASAELPKEGSRKYARIAVALRAVLKPNQGELAFDAELSPDSFVIDPHCRLRGGVSFRAWFAGSPRAGDFVYAVGGYHPNYRAPARYPIVPRLGFDWDLTGKVTISGSAYLAITPASAMAGGALDIRFQSGAVRAWCTAKVDVLIQWKPFYLEAGIRVSIGVSASVKIIFVRITITVEIGVSLTIWGPPTGGEATVKLWFISFTIGFGKGREGVDKVLDWPGFAAMLPPPASNVRVTPGAGLINSQRSGPGSGETWEVSANGFAFSTDSTVPLSKLFLGDATSPAESDQGLNIRPMDRQGLASNQRVKLALNGEKADLGGWSRSRGTATVPAELWGAAGQASCPAATSTWSRTGWSDCGWAPRHRDTAPRPDI